MTAGEAINDVEQAGHSNHLGTELWRRDTVHRIETGALPIRHAAAPVRRYNGRVATVLGTVLLGVVALLAALGGVS